MTTITAPTTTSTTSTDTKANPFTRTLPRTTVVVGLGAAVAVTALAAAAHAAGVSFEIEGEMIPLGGFAQMTFLGAVIGGVMLAAFNRFSGHAHRRFLETTVALTALTCLPSIALPDDVATKAVLVALHLVAAVIIIPVLARFAQD